MMPVPTLSEKKACPNAAVQIRGSASLEKSGVR
jgi:hypothetical protein